jgi:Calcium-dependent channel, 7TM region, putative phosphate
LQVTAGSILQSLAEIIDRPSNLLPLLGDSLPFMVGYFVALLVTKIMAGLPMIFLRFGALSRMLLLKTLSNRAKCTQRELDAIYRLENVQYGWEFPTQLLVVVIVFTYAIICPIILPFGCLYFTGALIVYKKQVLYVYSPVYESGGAMFPIAVQRTLFALVCGQLTLLGYTVTRQCYYQPIFLLPLPFMTMWTMNYFQKTYAIPSSRLSLERARECDRVSSLSAKADGNGLPASAETDDGVAARSGQFDKNSYRQPVLTELMTEPWFYRRGQEDEETLLVREQLRRINRHVKAADAAAKQHFNDLPSPI